MRKARSCRISAARCCASSNSPAALGAPLLAACISGLSAMPACSSVRAVSMRLPAPCWKAGPSAAEFAYRSISAPRARSLASTPVRVAARPRATSLTRSAAAQDLGVGFAHAQRQGRRVAAGQRVQPASALAGLAGLADLPVVLRLEVRAHRPRQACGRHKCQRTLLPQRQQRGQGGVQAKRVVQPECGLRRAVRRGDGNGLAQLQVVRVGMRHQRREPVVGAAQEHQHEAPGSLASGSGLAPAVLPARRPRAGPAHGGDGSGLCGPWCSLLVHVLGAGQRQARLQRGGFLRNARARGGCQPALQRPRVVQASAHGKGEVGAARQGLGRKPGGGIRLVAIGGLPAVQRLACAGAGSPAPG
jgi:hypothetical protein